jgi:hypothetical protein
MSSKKSKAPEAAAAAADGEAAPCISDAKYKEQWEAVLSFCEGHLPLATEKAKAILVKTLAGVHSMNELFEKFVDIGYFSVPDCLKFAFFLAETHALLKAGDSKEETFSKFDAGKAFKTLAKSALDYVEDEFWQHYGLEPDSSDDESEEEAADEEAAAN